MWFYDIQADGWSLDDKRAPLLPDDQLGAVPTAPFVVANHPKNNLPDAVDRWHQRGTSERHRARTEQSFTVPKDEIAAQGYDLSLNRYHEVVHDEVHHRPPAEILAAIETLEDEIRLGLDQLNAMLG